MSIEIYVLHGQFKHVLSSRPITLFQGKMFSKRLTNFHMQTDEMRINIYFFFLKYFVVLNKQKNKATVILIIAFIKAVTLQVIPKSSFPKNSSICSRDRCVRIIIQVCQLNGPCLVKVPANIHTCVYKKSCSKIVDETG